MISRINPTRPDAVPAMSARTWTAPAWALGKVIPAAKAAAGLLNTLITT